ncbi:MAG: FMN-binding protein [Bacteroidota bacterium]
MHSTNYILGFTLAMTTLVALALSGLFYATQSKAKQNEAVFNKRAVLKAVSTYLDKDVDDMSDEEVINIFEEQVKQYVLNMEGEEVEAQVVVDAGHKGGRAEDIDMAKEKKKPEADRLLPLFVFNSPKGDRLHIVSIRGNGLWDEIWGNVAISHEGTKQAMVVGATFDHKAETPGLGAEIKDNPSFPAQFKNKQLYKDGEFKSVVVRKGGAKDKSYEVDGISGATVTSDGVTEMLYRGIKYYEPFFEKLGDASSKPLGAR